MAKETDIPLIRRIAQPRRAEVRATGMSAGRAWRISLPRGADDGLGLDLTIKSFDEVRLPLPGVAELIQPGMLALTTSGPDKAEGLVLVDLQLLTGLIEIQTTGLVTAAPPEEREPTATDSAIIGHVLDAWMRNFDAVFADTPSDIPLTGFKTGRRLENARAVKLSLDEGGYLAHKLTLSLAEDARVAELTVVYPIDNIRGQSRDVSVPSGPPPIVLASKTELNAVIYRARLPLDQLQAFQKGDVIPLAGDPINSIRLETMDGRYLARARLGQADGQRALRLADLRERPKPKAIGQSGLSVAEVAGAADGVLSGHVPESEAVPELEGTEPVALPYLAEDPTATIGDGADLPDLGGDLPPVSESMDLGALADLAPLEPAADLPPIPDLPPLD